MSQHEKKPEPGDLIEIFRGIYQHWAIYVGEGYVIHLAPPCEYAQAGAYSMMSVLNDKARVKKEELYKVVGNDDYRINNLLDGKYDPRRVEKILRDAHSFVGKELPYCLISGNCEHFVTELRYGKAESRQVRVSVTAAAVGTGAVASIGTVAYFISKLLGSKDKQTQ
ncbi:phospholipase A and acyltransferase 3-like isoform X2 [Carassius gibelio]|uniref:phospholipase A and acyltransferase 3-like isoform X2 n=1 Tax=Carassius gibelio TaxID=101364 RepID=UPI0022782546|nr:phospholipase A and acyltransferase 3-like isoform X2 [Carassius gibelio]